MNRICIIGTDTGIGKTYVGCQILNYLTKYEKSALALKPISSGVIDTPYGQINEDVYNLYLASNIKLKFNQINPFSFNYPVAPHIAARIENCELNVNGIADKINQIISRIDYDYILIEGIGGLMVPLNMQDTYLDLLIKWNYPIILVVGMRLGCLNHALLTEAALINSGIKILGWVANCMDYKMDMLVDNLDYLKARLSMPLLAVIPFGNDMQPMPKFYEIFR